MERDKHPERESGDMALAATRSPLGKCLAVERPNFSLTFKADCLAPEALSNPNMRRP